jgi:hypothetical protein
MVSENLQWPENQKSNRYLVPPVFEKWRQWLGLFFAPANEPPRQLFEIGLSEADDTSDACPTHHEPQGLHVPHR